MADRTKIEWADATWNPIRAWLKSPLADQADKPPRNVGSHCELVSPGCENCYAEAINKRLGTRLPYRRLYRNGVEIFLDEKILLKPLYWKKPRRIFPCSMTDLFGEWVTDEMLDRIFAVMALCPQHVFLPLTKRPKRMRDYLSGGARREDAIDKQMDNIAPPHWCARELEKPLPLPNVWCGASVEDQRRADERIPLLLQTPAALRWISAEPLLGLVDLSPYMGHAICGSIWEDERGVERCDITGSPCEGINWIVVGGESGPAARPFDIAWARSIIAQCKTAGVPVFLKQLGANPGHIQTAESSFLHCKLRDRKGANPEEWPEDLRVREYPSTLETSQ